MREGIWGESRVYSLTGHPHDPQVLFAGTDVVVDEAEHLTGALHLRRPIGSDTNGSGQHAL